MASPNLYVRSTDGSDADNGTTWALAKATISGAAAIDSTTDNRIWVSQSHNETGASPTWALAGTNAIPTWIVAANDGAEPPTSVSTATVAPSSGSVTVNGSCYVYGLTIITASGLKFANNAGDTQLYDQCTLHYTGANSQFGPANTGNVNTFVRLRNCNLKLLSTSSSIIISGRVEIEGGAMVSGTSVNTGGLFITGGDRTHCELLISGFDFSALGTTHGMFQASSASSARMILRGCKFAASWAGTFLAGTILPGQRYEMHNCDSADTNYRLLIKDYGGDITSETTIVRTSGASDGTTGLAWKMATSANAKYPATGLVSPEIVQWNDTTGSAKTVTVEIVHDSQGAGSGSKFQDDEIWLEVMYLGTSGFPLGTWTKDAKADVLATAANQTDSSVTWTTTGLTTPVKQSLAVTFTPQEKGFIHARVVMAKASKTCYIDPLITVS